MVFILPLALAVALSWAACLQWSLDILIAWLLAITLVTFLVYGYDKAAAGLKKRRVPELALVGLVFVGGTVGALLGMGLFRHKTVKGSFRRKFWLVVTAQVLLIAAYLFWLKPAIDGS